MKIKKIYWIIFICLLCIIFAYLFGKDIGALIASF